jgi:hypothetical protein
MLFSLAAGCATGSTSGSEDVGSGPIVALSDDTGTKVPNLPELDRNAVSSDGAQAARVGPGSLTAPKKLALAGPFAISSCKMGAFCEDFEEPSPAKRWSSTIATAGDIDFSGPSSSLGAHALRAMTNGAGGAAYLTLDGSTLGAQWVGALAFSMRVEAQPVTALGGPEIAVVDANGATTRVGFSVRSDGIALHQFFESCSGSWCTSRSDLVTDVKPGEWRRLVVAVETFGTTTPPYGRVEVTVDDGDLIVLPLTVRPYDGQAKAHAGITVADTAPATARIDDVTFYAHSP